MRRRVLEVELNRHASLVRGPGAHELLLEVTGRRPTWMSRLRAFSVQEATARNVIVAAERRGYDVLIAGRRSADLVSRGGQGVADAAGGADAPSDETPEPASPAGCGAGSGLLPVVTSKCSGPEATSSSRSEDLERGWLW